MKRNLKQQEEMDLRRELDEEYDLHPEECEED